MIVKTKRYRNNPYRINTKLFLIIRTSSNCTIRNNVIFHYTITIASSPQNKKGY